MLNIPAPTGARQPFGVGLRTWPWSPAWLRSADSLSSRWRALPRPVRPAPGRRSRTSACRGGTPTRSAVARTGDGVLHVLWAESTGKSVFNTRLSSDAQNVLGTSTVFQYGGSRQQLRGSAARARPGPCGHSSPACSRTTRTTTAGCRPRPRPTACPGTCNQRSPRRRTVRTRHRRSTPRQASAAPCSTTAPRCRSGATRHRGASGYHVGHEPGDAGRALRRHRRGHGRSRGGNGQRHRRR